MSHAALTESASVTAKHPGWWHAVAEIARTLLEKWNEDNVLQLSAALSYFMFFSLAPLLIISIAIAGLVFGQQAVLSNLMTQIQDLAGADAANTVGNIIQSLNHPAASIPGAVLGIIALTLGALGVFGQVKGSLNYIWRVPRRPSHGLLKDVLGAVRDEFILFSMVLLTGFLLLVSLLLNAILTVLADAIQARIGEPLAAAATFWSAVDLVLSFGLTAFLFAAIYRILPDTYIRWRDVAVGALLTAALFSLGKYLIGLYLGHSGIATAYGAAGSLVIILLWINYSAQIFYLGAEFTHIYTLRYGSKSDKAQGQTPSAQP